MCEWGVSTPHSYVLRMNTEKTSRYACVSDARNGWTVARINPFLINGSFCRNSSAASGTLLRTPRSRARTRRCSDPPEVHARGHGRLSGIRNAARRCRFRAPPTDRAERRFRTGRYIECDLEFPKPVRSLPPISTNNPVPGRAATGAPSPLLRSVLRPSRVLLGFEVRRRCSRECLQSGHLSTARRRYRPR